MNKSLEHGRALLERAHGDAMIFRELLHKAEIPEWSLGFHAQQAVEKALKSVLS